MTVISIEEIKAKFEGGDRPRSADYINLIDTLATLPLSGEGPSGPQGDPGLVGLDGADGAQGIQGLVGLDGADGAQGIQGLVGNTGAVGSPGSNGTNGVQGANGIQGVKGLTGNTGIQGITGETGLTGNSGIQGIQGASGSQGQAGISVTLKGSVANTGALPSTGNTIGDSYINQADGNLYVWTGIWHDAGQIVGPEGLQGQQGIQGEAGVAGITGAAGSNGTNGVQGVQGVQGLIGATGLTGTGITIGGTAGQALTKIDSTNYNSAWTTIPSFSTANTFTGGVQQITTANASTKALVIQGSASQSANYFEVQNSSGVALISLTPSGRVITTTPTPNAQTATNTLTIANLAKTIITCTSATAVTLTLPTGTLMDSGFATLSNDMSFTWSIINLGSVLGAVTMATGTDHTYVGNATVAVGSSAAFTSRRASAATWVSYRVS